MNKGNLILVVGLFCMADDLSAQQPKTGKATSRPDTIWRAGKEINVREIVGPGTFAASPAEDEIVSGLKEALSIGAEKSAGKLSARDGFFGNQAIKLLLPPEAVKVEQKLRSVGMGRQVDQVVMSMNRAAEDAAASAAPIFIRAIKGMTFGDAAGILKGGDTSATTYLRQKTSGELTEAFRPVIERSLSKVDATRYWDLVFSTYNRFSRDKVNPDLAAYVTEKALQGIFFQLGEEERLIRKDPMARTSGLLKKVFGMK
jgi:hypothetical protein